MISIDIPLLSPRPNFQQRAISACERLREEAAANLELIAKYGEVINIAEQPEQRLIVFDTQQHAAPPCEHLVLLDVHCDVQPAQRRGGPRRYVNCGWSHPSLKRSDSCAEGYIWQLYDCQDSEEWLPKELLPTVPFQWIELENSSDPVSLRPGDLRLCVFALVLFAGDVEKLLVEAADLQPLT